MKKRILLGGCLIGVFAAASALGPQTKSENLEAFVRAARD